MTSRERFLKVLAGEMPDRVPVTLFILDQGHFLNQMYPSIDHNELYSLFLTDYEFYERLMNFAMNRILDYTRAIDEAGVDVHCIGGNVPGGFLGRRTYDRYVLPFEKKYIAFVQRNGTPAMYHNCGQITVLTES